MADLPIPFTAPMVRALLAGTKTQTRRLLSSKGGSQRLICRSCGCTEREWKDGAHDGPECAGMLEWTDCDKPRYRIGDRLYVREAWRMHFAHDGTRPRDLSPSTRPIIYAADETDKSYAKSRGKLRQGMFMPRWASRITLIVTGVWIQRLQDISEEDAIAEGINCYTYGELAAEGMQHIKNGPTDASKGLFSAWNARKDVCGLWYSAADAYAELWNEINADRAPWKTNPWVVAYTFTFHHKHIDRMPS